MRNGDANPLHLYPIELIQISSRGFPHNHFPMAIEKTLPALDDEKPTRVPSYRFFASRAMRGRVQAIAFDW